MLAVVEAARGLDNAADDHCSALRASQPCECSSQSRRQASLPPVSLLIRSIKRMEIYGHKQLNLFFVPLLQIHDDGFIFKNKNYSWADIKHVFVWEPFEGLGALLGTGAIPRATIELRDGRKIKIHSSVFRKKGEKSKVGFLSGKSEAFVKVIDLFKEKTA